VKTLVEHAGGEPAIHRFVEVFYGHVLADPLLQPLFGDGKPQHIAHLTAFTVECFGGVDTYTKQMGGFLGLIAAHRGLRIQEPQRLRFVELYMASAGEVGLPSDAPFREALRSHVEFGSDVAKQNSHATTDAELHPLREVPMWTWPDQVPPPPAH
jgi:hemoglobin